MPASMQGEMQPTIYRFKLGGFEVATVWTARSSATGLHPRFGGDAGGAEVKSWPRANRIDADRYEHPFMPTIVNTGKQLVLFDTGNGSLRARIRAAQRPAAAGPSGRAAGAGRLQARGRRRGRHHARPSRPHRRADQRRQAGVSQGALRVRRHRFRFLEEGRERARGAQVQSRAVHEDRGAAGRPSRPSSSRATRWCRASARSMPSAIRPA